VLFIAHFVLKFVLRVSLTLQKHFYEIDNTYPGFSTATLRFDQRTNRFLPGIPLHQTKAGF
jgi:hypothetical protein